MENNRILALLSKKLLKEELSEAEHQELDQWLQDPTNKAFFEREINAGGVFASLRQLDEMNEKRLDEKMAVQMGQRSEAGRLRKVWPYWAAAASVLVVLVGGMRLWEKRRVLKEGQVIVATIPRDIPPGGNRALLTLSDGSEIRLDNVQNGALAQQGGSQVSKIADGKLSYKTLGNGKAPGFNMVATPRGGQYAVRLPDGTGVWLNAGSSVRFPTAFNGSTREVEMTGEAYFEVAPDKEHPFIVNTGKVEIRVLGTRFDVMAYDDEKTINTTLLAGSVAVKGDNHSAVLHPGEQARAGVSGLQVEKDVSVDEAVAWKNGLFEFNGADISTVMRSIARWYDVEVRYEAQKDSHRFTGQLNRDLNISDALQILASSGYHFRVDGKVITVLP